MQTIHQYRKLVSEYRKLDGTIPGHLIEYTAQGLKDEYAARVLEKVQERMDNVDADETRDRGEFLVPCAKDFLEALRERGVKLYLASGTDNGAVQEEARYLGLADLFESLEGAVGYGDDCIKTRVIREVVARNNLQLGQLLVVGDSGVEIRSGVASGAVTIGVCTEDHNRYEMNQNKKERLKEAGAHILMPDYSDRKNYGALFEWLGIRS